MLNVLFMLVPQNKFQTHNSLKQFSNSYYILPNSLENLIQLNYPNYFITKLNIE